MIRLYQTLAEMNPDMHCAVMTVIEGDRFGEKALFADGELRWERDGNGFFSEHRQVLCSMSRSGDLLLDGQRVFCEVLGGEKKLVICGAGHVGLALIPLGLMLGFQVTVLEDRAEFAEKAEKAGAHRVLCMPFS